jgi:DNA-binding transcriptional LysR family regulator
MNVPDLETIRAVAQAGSVPRAVASGDASSGLLAHSLATFLKRHPLVRVEVRTHPAPARLAAGEADIVRWASVGAEESAVGRKAMTVQYAVFAAAEVAALPPSERRWVMLESERGVGLQSAWEAENIPPDQVALRTTSRGIHVDAVRAGLGVGLLPLVVGTAYRLTRLSEPIVELHRPLWVLAQRVTFGGEVTEAIAFWSALTRFLADGGIPIDNAAGSNHGRSVEHFRLWRPVAGLLTGRIQQSAGASQSSAQSALSAGSPRS